MSTHLDLESPWFGHPWALTHGEFAIRMVKSYEAGAGVWSYKVLNDPQLYGLMAPGEMVEVQIDPSGLREPEHFKKKCLDAGAKAARKELSVRVADVAGRRGLKGVGNCAVLFSDPRLAEYLAAGGGQIIEEPRGEFYVVRIKAPHTPAF